MPQWAGSCWYYLRYLDPRNAEEIFSAQSYDDWMPVDLYVGGAEHAVLHLLYARFWHKVLFDLGVVKHPEPFQKLVHQGMILGEPTLVGYRSAAGDAVSADRVKAGESADSFVDQGSGQAVDAVTLDAGDVEKKGGAFVLKANPAVKVQSVAFKMAKSRGNVVNPDDVVREFGADSLRVYEMFMGPLEQVKPWQTAGLKGVRRFLDRVHHLANRPLSDEPMTEATAKAVHKAIRKVGEDIEALRFNTAVSTMMELVNLLYGSDAPPRAALENLVLLLSPFAPHLAEELWAKPLGHPSSIADQPWPAYDPQLTVDDVVEIAVQVNGKVRGRVTLARDAAEDVARDAGLADPHVAKFLEGGQLRKVIYVPGKILNLIIK
jgi:leucyl-tRNA synthetase